MISPASLQCVHSSRPPSAASKVHHETFSISARRYNGDNHLTGGTGARGFKVTPEPSPLPPSAQTWHGMHPAPSTVLRPRSPVCDSAGGSQRESAHNPPHYEMPRTDTCMDIPHLSVFPPNNTSEARSV